MKTFFCHSFEKPFWKKFAKFSHLLLFALFLGWEGGLAFGDLMPDPLEPPLQLKNSQEALAILRDSKDGVEMAKAAIWLCKSNAPDALDRLFPFLQDPNFWNRMDSYRLYGRETINTHPRIGRVLEEIGKLSTPKAEEVLLKLINDKEFRKELGRELGLIDACGWLQNPSPKILEYLDSSGWSQQVVKSLARISTPESCALLRRRIISLDGSVSNGLDWFVNFLLPVRSKPAIASLYKQVLESKIPDARLRNTIVQSLFDYKPKWYGEDGPWPSPPKWSETSPEVLKQVLEIADMALKMDITSETRDGVLKAQKEIQQILLEKQKK